MLPKGSVQTRSARTSKDCPQHAKGRSAPFTGPILWEHGRKGQKRICFHETVADLAAKRSGKNSAEGMIANL